MNEQINISQETFEYIEAYLLQQLSEKEMIAVEKRMATDSKFALQVSEIATIIDGIETACLSNKLDDFHKDLEYNKKPKFKNGFLKYAIAASILVALALAWLLSRPNAQEQLYAEYYSPDPGLPTVMSTTSEFDFYDGMVSYKQGKYEEALEKWQPLKKDKPANDTLNYFIGMAYMANGDTDASLPYLDETIENSASVFLAEAIYYKALALVKAKNYEKAISVLKAHPTERNRTLAKAIHTLKNE